MPIDRMKTSGIEEVVGQPDPVAEQRPCENGLDGSTDTTPTDWSSPRTWRTSAEISVDLPTPGGRRRTRARVEVADDLVGERIGVLDERDRARERALVAARTPAASVSRVHSRRRAIAPDLRQGAGAVVITGGQF